MTPWGHVLGRGAALTGLVFTVALVGASLGIDLGRTVHAACPELRPNPGGTYVVWIRDAKDGCPLGPLAPIKP